MKHSLRVVAAACATVASTAAFAQLTLPITDNFPSAGPQQQWEDYADAAYMAGKVVAKSPTAPSGDGFAFDVNDGSGHGSVFLVNDTGNLSDYKITAYVYCADGSGSNWSRLGIIARAQTGSGNAWAPPGYYLTVDNDGNNYARCFAMGTVTYPWVEHYAVATIDTDIDAGVPRTGNHAYPAWLKLELSVTGTSLVAEIDDVQIATGTTSLYSAGRIAIYNLRNTATSSSTFVDRITVESTAPASVADWTLY